MLEQRGVQRKQTHGRGALAENGDCTAPSRRRGHIRDALLVSLRGRVPYKSCPLFSAGVLGESELALQDDLGDGGRLTADG